MKERACCAGRDNTPQLKMIKSQSMEKRMKNFRLEAEPKSRVQELCNSVRMKDEG